MKAFKTALLVALTVTALSGCAMFEDPKLREWQRQEEFGTAAAKGDLKRVKELLEENPSLATTDFFALINAACNGHIEVVELLLSYEADVEAGRPLYLVAGGVVGSKQERVEMVRFLLDHGADPNATAVGGESPLHAAVRNGYVATAGVLLERGADVNARNNAHETPLFYAVGGGSKAMFDFLLAHGADRSPRADDRRLLQAAVQSGNIEMLEMLIAQGEDVLALDGTSGAAPIHTAAGLGRVEVIHVLVKHGASVRQKTRDGLEPIHSAASWGRVDSIEALLALGADVNAVGNAGQTPLHRAATGLQNRVAAIEFLLQHGASINARDKDGKTPLGLALLRPRVWKVFEGTDPGYEDAVKILRRHGGTE